MQRIRIGLTGLACVFLLVLIGTAGLNPTKSQIAAAKQAAPEEPLAQLGVAPGSTAAVSASAAQSKAISVPPPDLRKDGPTGVTASRATQDY